MDYSPEFHILLHTFVITEIIFSPPDFNNSPVILSTPCDLPLFNEDGKFKFNKFVCDYILYIIILLYYTYYIYNVPDPALLGFYFPIYYLLIRAIHDSTLLVYTIT